jgi:hypothetical protein
MFDQGWLSPRDSRGDKRNILGSGDVLGAVPRIVQLNKAIWGVSRDSPELSPTKVLGVSLREFDGLAIPVFDCCSLSVISAGTSHC